MTKQTEHPDYKLDHDTHKSNHVIGTMDIEVQEKTYIGFLKATKYLVIVSVAAILLLAFLTL